MKSILLRIWHAVAPTVPMRLYFWIAVITKFESTNNLPLRVAGLLLTGLVSLTAFLKTKAEKDSLAGTGGPYRDATAGLQEEAAMLRREVERLEKAKPLTTDSIVMLVAVGAVVGAFVLVGVAAVATRSSAEHVVDKVVERALCAPDASVEP